MNAAQKAQPQATSAAGPLGIATVALARQLVRRPSLTPKDEGCQNLIAQCLRAAGFSCETLSCNETVNLLATHGEGSPFTLFLGHTDVVPPGEENLWEHPPFGAELVERPQGQYLTGRGSADMKGSDAAFTIALCHFVASHPEHQGRIGLLVTSNEEGDGQGGVSYVAELLSERGLIPDYCLVGEPSSLNCFGDQIKVGRRGSLTAHLTVLGVQGHVAYPERCDNAALHAARLMNALFSERWDEGTEFFPPSTFQITNLNCGSGAENMVPGACRIMCNWRFNDRHTPESLKARVQKLAADLGVRMEERWVINGLPFITQGGALLEALQEAVERNSGQKPQLSTSGGTSDGRFIAPLGTQTVEFGPLSQSIHKVNEEVSCRDLGILTLIYKEVLERLHQDRD